MDRPAYLNLDDATLGNLSTTAIERLRRCILCARRCGADRTAGTDKAGCRIGRLAKVHSWGPDGIRFGGCSLRCLHCPTPDAAWEGVGEDVTAGRLAGLMLEIQALGSRIVALHQPSHVAAHIVEALPLAVAGGLSLPLAWVGGGFDSLETLRLLDGIVDLYVPEAKFGVSAVARQCAGVPRYAETNREVIAEMHRQVGPLVFDALGIPARGLLVRHQVLPDGMAGTRAALEGLPPGTTVSLDVDYRPVFRADRHPRLNRLPSTQELVEAEATATQLGLVVRRSTGRYWGFGSAP